MILGAGLGLMRSSPVGGGGGLLLDQFPGASVAYSLRLLSNTYSGDCVKVRRDSDNTEQSIGFSGGVVDMASITTFCGGASSGIAGHVSTWYDQSGNGVHLSQTTHGSQFRIVTDGDSFYMWNGHPKIIDWGRNSMITGSFTTIPAGWSGTNFNVTDTGVHYGQLGLWIYIWGSTMGLSISPATPYKVMSGTWTTIFSGTITPPASQFNLSTMIWNDAPGDCSLYVNGVFDDSVNTFTPTNYNQFRLPYTSSNDQPDIAEMIFYPSDVGSDRAGIETNIIDYYGI